MFSFSAAGNVTPPLITLPNKRLIKQNADPTPDDNSIDQEIDDTSIDIEISEFELNENYKLEYTEEEILQMPIVLNMAENAGSLLKSGKQNRAENKSRTVWKVVREVKGDQKKKKKQNGTFVSIGVSTPFLAVNDDTQKYFEILNDQVIQAISIAENSYIYDPTIIENPNYIIDQIYLRVDESVCRNTLYTLKTIAWKELHKPNAWLFIANVSSRVAIICEGRRQEVTLNNTGILLVAPHCIIKTKLNTLQYKAIETFSVIGIYNRKIEPPILHKDAHETSSNLDIDEEPVLKAPDTISRLKNEASDIDEECTTYRWKRAITHSTIFRVIIIATILLTIFIFYWAIKRLRRARCLREKSSNSSDSFIPRSLHLRKESKEEVGIGMRALSREAQRASRT
ncbi:hypothetical protein HHI36_003751 [Cryptolaemus montrouzieri]|uniref:Uncharacterized protein n=1 Tax=Cryptolaemus montrouzieri TaxID=559131 RepID=A0ABD2PEA7_9CUCU